MKGKDGETLEIFESRYGYYLAFEFAEEDGGEGVAIGEDAEHGSSSDENGVATPC